MAFTPRVHAALVLFPDLAPPVHGPTFWFHRASVAVAASDRLGSSLPDCRTGAHTNESIAIRSVVPEVPNVSYKTRAVDATVPECMNL